MIIKRAWYKDGHLLEPAGKTDRYRFTNELHNEFVLLRIKNLRKDDKGFFECVAWTVGPNQTKSTNFTRQFELVVNDANNTLINGNKLHNVSAEINSKLILSKVKNSLKTDHQQSLEDNEVEEEDSNEDEDYSNDESEINVNQISINCKHVSLYYQHDIIKYFYFSSSNFY